MLNCNIKGILEIDGILKGVGKDDILILNSINDFKSLIERIFSEGENRITVNYVPDNRKIKEYPIAVVAKESKSSWEKNKETSVDKIYEKGSDVYTVLIGEIGENPYDEGTKEAEEYDEICRNLTENISNLKINGISAKFEKE